MSLANQVILFVIDGLRPDASRKTHTPHIYRLVAQGSYSWRAQTVDRSVSLPCHHPCSWLYRPKLHGAVFNEWARKVGHPLGLPAPTEWSGQSVVEALDS